MGKLALVTGASAGIGKEIATIHAENGGDLVIVARSEDKLKQLKEALVSKHSIAVTIMLQDLAKPNASSELYQNVKEAGLELDYLINNAGFGGYGKFHEREMEKDLSMIQLNVVTLTALTRLFLADFVARDHGRVLNVSSTASLVPGPMQAVYYATKAFVTSFSYAVAEELHDSAVTITALMPGATETEFARQSGMEKTDLFRNPASARDVAQDGYDAMLAGKLSVISGLTLTQRLMLTAVPFVPKKWVLSTIRNAQTIKD